jgi:hypothetical protein
MAAPDELVPDLDVAADPPEDLGMGKKGGDFQHGQPIFYQKRRGMSLHPLKSTI